MRISILRKRILERPNNIEEEMKVRNVTRKKIDKIDRLKAESEKIYIM